MKEEKRLSKNGFVAGGYYRAYLAVEPEVRATAQAEYSERLNAAASFFGRMWIRWKMERQIRRQVNERASPAALY